MEIGRAARETLTPDLQRLPEAYTFMALQAAQVLLKDPELAKAVGLPDRALAEIVLAMPQARALGPLLKGAPQAARQIDGAVKAFYRHLRGRSKPASRMPPAARPKDPKRVRDFDNSERRLRH